MLHWKFFGEIERLVIKKKSLSPSHFEIDYVLAEDDALGQQNLKKMKVIKMLWLKPDGHLTSGPMN